MRQHSVGHKLIRHLGWRGRGLESLPRSLPTQGSGLLGVPPPR